VWKTLKQKSCNLIALQQQPAEEQQNNYESGVLPSARFKWLLQGCHLAFLKQFVTNKMIWPFLNIEKNCIF
jgi:hypothetical protein